MFFSMGVIDKKKLWKIELLYEKLCTLRHTLILKKFEKKNCEFEVLYNCVKFRRLKMGDPVSRISVPNFIELGQPV